MRRNDVVRVDGAIVAGSWGGIFVAPVELALLVDQLDEIRETSALRWLLVAGMSTNDPQARALAFALALAADREGEPS